APRAAKAAWLPESALVSPVGTKTKDWKPVPGTNWPFSGRLNGVAPAALARALASKSAVPLTAVAWTVNQRTGQELPRVWSFSWLVEKTSPVGCEASTGTKETGAPSIITWRAWSLPAVRSAGLVGTKR